jgi:branched-chain amino acid transport system permease protein
MQDAMSAILLLEQSLNGLQFGLMLFLLAAGLTLVFGIMDMINLAHGSIYMVGAYLVASMAMASGSFWLGLALGVVTTAGIAALLEYTVLRRLYQRDHLSQVLGTFAILLMSNELVRLVWGAQPIALNPPPVVAGPVELLPGFTYPAYRLFIIGVGLLVALLLYLLVTRTRYGMQVRAGASNREMALAMGVDVRRLFTAVFALGAALCAVAGGLLGPLLAVQVGMGESILILAFVVIVIGGIGSIRGALLGAMLVGVVDTAGRALIPPLFAALFGAESAANAGPALASILIYVLMAGVLFFKPQGLFPAHG